MYLKTRNNLIYEIKNVATVNYGHGPGIEADFMPIMGMTADTEWHRGWWPMRGTKIRLRMEEL